MFSKIFLNRKNMLYNLSKLEEISDKKICAMVKADAYGHGMRQIIEILNDKLDYFGVSNQNEALTARKYTSKDIIVFGACEDYKLCMLNDVSFALFSYSDAKKIVKIAIKDKLKPKMHLCINTGMNRYGIKTTTDLVKIINLLKKNKLQLEGIYTHFSSLTSDKNYTEMQKEKFESFLSLLPRDWKTIKHIGGGRAIFENIQADMVRVGLELYGYGNDFVKPVLSVKSEIVDKQKVARGEHIGYLCGYTAKTNMTVATIPLGYGDGLPRKLSNTLVVEIKGQKAQSTGNICMDAFMVDVTDIKCKIGDSVTIFNDATTLAKLLDTTEYEVLSNLCKFRGERIII